MSPLSLIKYLQFSWPITIILIVFFQIICALFPDVPRIIYAGTRISYVKRSRFFVSLNFRLRAECVILFTRSNFKPGLFLLQVSPHPIHQFHLLLLLLRSPVNVIFHAPSINHV